MTETETDTKALTRKAYGAATQALRDNHRDEFNSLMKQKAADLGIEWEPRKTPEEKAVDEVNRILSEHPSVAERLRKALAGEGSTGTENGAQSG